MWFIVWGMLRRFMMKFKKNVVVMMKSSIEEVLMVVMKVVCSILKLSVLFMVVRLKVRIILSVVVLVGVVYLL